MSLNFTSPRASSRLRAKESSMKDHIVIFDLDGTLLDSISTGRERFFKTARLCGLPLDDHSVRVINEQWSRGKYYLIQRCWPHFPVKDFYTRWEYLDVSSEYSVYPHVHRTLEELTEYQYSLVLFTHRRPWTTMEILQKHTLNDFFVHIEACWGDGINKDSPSVIENIQRVCTRLNAKHVTLVGDSVTQDLAAARKLGARFIATGYGITRAEDFTREGVPYKDIIFGIHEVVSLLE